MVVTSNYPLYFFALRISVGIDAAPEIVLPEFDGDPADWIPDTAQIQLLQSADLVILNGAGAERWLDLITLHRRRLVDTASALTGKLIPLDDALPHQHGPKGEHSHQGSAFTFWLDPLLAIAQAQAVTEALALLTPAQAQRYRENMATLEQELMKLDRRLADVFGNLHDRPLLFSHPVYHYLQRRYSIDGASLHWEPDAPPTLSGWTALRRQLAFHPATVMVWEDAPLPDTVSRLAGLGIESVPFHTLANRPAQGDFTTAMLENARRLETILQADD
jgi:zinc transport system substrate-binding protein